MSYLSQFSSTYTTYTHRSLPRFDSSQHAKYNAEVAARFAKNLFAPGYKWADFLLFVFTHNPLKLQDLTNYNSLSTLQLCVRDFWGFSQAHRQDIEVHGYRQTILDHAQELPHHEAVGFAAQLQTYLNMAGRQGCESS